MIALEYKCSIENIKEWNHLGSDALSSGQILEIRIPGSQAYRYNDVIKTQKNTNSPNDPYVYYTMQKEDDLEVIVGKFSGLTYENVLEINNIKNKGELLPGSKVKIDYKR
jgi:membrane-bound lytic murein transglycosylase D